jgi:hypothetical protein
MVLDNPTDCLVFKLEEFDCDDLRPDTALFFIYDSNNEEFIIRGRRACSLHSYAFTCKYACDVVSFIEFVISDKNLLSYTLYSFEALPVNQSDITMDYLETITDCKTNDEVSGYDNKTFNTKQISDILKMIQNVFNYY